MGRRAGVLLQGRWRDRLQRFGRSRLSVAEFCRREKVSAASFYQWRKKLAATVRQGQDAMPAATLLPVQVAVAKDMQVG